MTFNTRLGTIQRKSRSLLCIGLDPDTRKLPAPVRRSRNPLYEFNAAIIEATHDLVCAYKPNLAFYEAHGIRGWEALRSTLACIPRNVLTIGDAKRGDIGNTATLYAKALFRDMGFDACTVNPYMGEDSLAPFIADPRKGAFVVALTSNGGAKDFQYLRARGKPLYEHVVRRALRWNTRGNCGLVVGATHPQELKQVRAIAPGLPILIPGIGAQGGDLRAAVRFGCARDGTLAIINVSRSVLYASAGRDFARAARSAALALNKEIDRLREVL